MGSGAAQGGLALALQGRRPAGVLIIEHRRHRFRFDGQIGLLGGFDLIFAFGDQLFFIVNAPPAAVSQVGAKASDRIEGPLFAPS